MLTSMYRSNCLRTDKTSCSGLHTSRFDFLCYVVVSSTNALLIETDERLWCTGLCKQNRVLGHEGCVQRLCSVASLTSLHNQVLY
jgi:hypothetical protein